MSDDELTIVDDDRAVLREDGTYQAAFLERLRQPLWQFTYHGGAKVTYHRASPEFIDRARTWAEAHGLDVEIAEIPIGS